MKTYASTAAMANLKVHNERAWNEDHPAPWYLLDEAHQDRRGNVAIVGDLTPAKVLKEYLETVPYGMKHGRLHHKARPFRETVVVCEDRHGREDLAKLMAAFEERLPGFRTMYGHLHRDEGYIDKTTGQAKRNYHMHIGHTNLADGALVDPGKLFCNKMQDIAAEVLGMERGTPQAERAERRPHLEPSVYRRLAQERDQAIADEQTKTAAAAAENHQLRESLARRDGEYKLLRDQNKELVSWTAELYGRVYDLDTERRKDAQALERLRDDQDLDPNLATVEDLVDTLIRQRAETPVEADNLRRQHEEKRVKIEKEFLGHLNRTVRAAMKASGNASQATYSKWKAVIDDKTQPLAFKVEVGCEFMEILSAENTGFVALMNTGRNFKQLQDYAEGHGMNIAEVMPYLQKTVEDLRQSLRENQDLQPGSAAPAKPASQETAPKTATTGPRPTRYDRPHTSGSRARVKFWEEEEEEEERRGR